MTDERTDRSPDEGTQDSAADRQGPEEPTTSGPRMVESVCFLLAGRLMAIPIDQVAEAVELPPITPMFHLPKWVRGLAPLRGDILQVLDLAELFDLPSELGDTSRVLVVRSNDQRWGVVVSEIAGVKQLREAETAARQTPGVPSWAMGLYADGPDPVLLLDMNRLAEHVGAMDPTQGGDPSSTRGDDGE